MERTILHIDMNSCYASIECLHHPELAGLPVAVGGEPRERHGIILAKNEPAKRAGVTTGETLWQAQAKCPGLVILPPRFRLYLRFSRMAREIYGEYTDRVEPFGLDEAWADVTADGRDGRVLADEIRRRVKEELGVTVSVGVSYNKVLAKLGSDYKKPDAVTVFGRSDLREKVWLLPARDLLYVGPATERKLAGYGIRTIGGIAQTDGRLLSAWLGKQGELLGAWARGEDASPVARAGDTETVKSIGNSITPPRDLLCEGDAGIIFGMLAESVAERLRESGLLARTAAVSLRANDLSWCERQLRLDSPTCLAKELYAAAMALLRRGCDFDTPLRSVGLRAADLTAERDAAQCSLFCDEAAREREERLERAVDEVRRRFGHFAISRAAAVSDGTLANIDAGAEHFCLARGRL